MLPMAQTVMLNVALLKLFKETLLMKTDASSGLLLKVRLFDYYANILEECASLQLCGPNVLKTISQKGKKYM